jgi:hypothetical protein
MVIMSWKARAAASADPPLSPGMRLNFRYMAGLTLGWHLSLDSQREKTITCLWPGPGASKSRREPGVLASPLKGGDEACDEPAVIEAEPVDDPHAFHIRPALEARPEAGQQGRHGIIAHRTIGGIRKEGLESGSLEGTPRRPNEAFRKPIRHLRQSPRP